MAGLRRGEAWSGHLGRRSRAPRPERDLRDARAAEGPQRAEHERPAGRRATWGDFLRAALSGGAGSGQRVRGGPCLGGRPGAEPWGAPAPRC